jgi:hypothetical protein
MSKRIHPPRGNRIDVFLAAFVPKQCTIAFYNGNRRRGSFVLGIRMPKVLLVFLG